MFPFIAALCSIWLLGGCVTSQPRPIDTAAVAAAWQAIDAGAATSAVTAALETRGPPATAKGFDLGDGINLAEAEATALFFNPAIRVTRLQVAIPQSEARHAGLWEDPELEIDGEYILDDVDEPLVIGAGLAITIPLSGRPMARQRLAEARIDSAVAAVLGAEWALLAKVRRQWIGLAGHRARTKLLQRSVDELQQLIELAPRLRAAQAITVADERLLRIQQRRAQDALYQAEVAAAEQQLALIETLGLHPEQPWRFQTAFDTAGVDVAEIDPAAIRHHPRLRELMAAYQVAERRLELEVRGQYPDLRFGLGGGSEDGDSRILFGLGLVPIPLWNANRLRIAGAEAERSVAAAEIEAALHDLTHRVAVARRKHQASAARLTFLESELAPLIDRQVQDVRRLAGLGQLDLFLLAEAMQQAREIRLDLLDARVNGQLAALELAALAGPPEAVLPTQSAGVLQ
jgi:outer membrane protein TolC